MQNEIERKWIETKSTETKPIETNETKQNIQKQNEIESRILKSKLKQYITILIQYFGCNGSIIVKLFWCAFKDKKVLHIARRRHLYVWNTLLIVIAHFCAKQNNHKTVPKYKTQFITFGFLLLQFICMHTSTCNIIRKLWI